jgi:hypothetical protein
MRQSILRRLEALEKDHRSREQRERSLLQDVLVHIWTIVLAYYLGDLQSDEDITEAHARALKYPSEDDYFAGLLEGEIRERYNDAYRRLFAKVGLEFDDTPRSVLFDALVTMVNRLPEKWLNWLRSHWGWYRGAPRGLSGDNAFPYT